MEGLSYRYGNVDPISVGGSDPMGRCLSLLSGYPENGKEEQKLKAGFIGHYDINDPCPSTLETTLAPLISLRRTVRSRHGQYYSFVAISVCPYWEEITE